MMTTILASILLLACDPALEARFLTWDVRPVEEATCNGQPVALPDYFEVVRVTVSSGSAYHFTTLRNPVPSEPEWCVVSEDPLPRAGTLYRYEIRAWRSGTDPILQCVDGPPPTVDLCGPPIACFTAGHESQCYPGAPCRTCGPNGCRHLGTPECP